MKVEWVENRNGSEVLTADFGDGLSVSIGEYCERDGATEYDAFLLFPRNGLRRLGGGMTLEAAREATEKALPMALEELVAVGQAAERVLRGEP